MNSKKHKLPTINDPQRSRQSVVGKSIQHGMTLSHSKGDSSLATVKAKLSKMTSLRHAKEERKRSTHRCLAQMVDPIFSLCCLLPAPCHLTSPATQDPANKTRKGNYKKHAFITDSRISINQIRK